MHDLLQAGERIDQLFADDIQIIQSRDVFSFSLDAVLLANFATAPKRGAIVDLCAGNGAISLFMSRKTTATITGIELQARLADMGRRSIALNEIGDRVRIETLDIKDVTTIIPKDSVDLVVCNPPYFKDLPTNTTNPNPYLAAARHEIHTNLEGVVAEAAKLLKFHGKLALVHRPERITDILTTMEKYRIVPKRMQLIHPKAGKDANIVLIEGIHHGKPDGLKVLPSITVYGDDGNYQDEVEQMLYGK